MVWLALLPVACGSSSSTNANIAADGAGGQVESTKTGGGVGGQGGAGGQAGSPTESGGGGHGGGRTDDDGGQAGSLTTRDGGEPALDGRAEATSDALDSAEHAVGDSKAPDVACRDDGGFRLASAARVCEVDSDCAITVRATCCGSDNAYGIAKAVTDAYAACFALAPGACQGLGCAKFIGYATDTGELTQRTGSPTSPLSEVAVHCAQHLCTTNLATSKDAGGD